MPLSPPGNAAYAVLRAEVVSKLKARYRVLIVGWIAVMAIIFTILRNGSDFSCKPDNATAFFVGRRVPYEGNIGLYNVFPRSRLERLDYQVVDFEQKYGLWATLIEPTAICEGRNFLTLNTYDRAAFTFGFGQFAAHVPNGDFVKYLRAMLALPQAPDYFPHLGVVNGRISQTDGSPIALESDTTTSGLMRYLNPGLREVQDAEVIAAAKLIHWTSNSVDARAAQVAQMIAVFKSFMARADQRVGIDQRPANQCCVIADILHQGRGNWVMIEQALRSSTPYQALVSIGDPRWRERTRKLKAAIDARPQIAAKRWNRAQADFV